MNIETIKTAIEGVGLVGAAIAFSAGLWQYMKAQRWKVTEFVANEIDAMKANPSVRSAMFMLDWDGREIDLHPDQEDHDKRWIAVTHEDLVRALQPHPERTGFTADESRIRDIFDDFLDSLARIQQFVVADLVEAEHFRPYLQYWITIISDRTRLVRPDGVPALWKYVDHYKDAYGGVQDLMTSFGHPIVPPSPILQDATSSSQTAAGSA